MIKLRTLLDKDIPGMLEWMHDEDIASHFRFNCLSTTYDDVLNFVKKSHSDDKNRHFAIVDKDDEYLGTISLKNIDFENLKAEYAVVLRKKYHGCGYGKIATDLIVDYAFNELGLNKIYLNVLEENSQAISFYEKYGFIYEGCAYEDIIIDGKKKNLKWYCLLKGETNE